jgi:hypothetical protein
VVDFLDLLVSLKTLVREDSTIDLSFAIIQDNRYFNHPTAARFLVAGSDDFCGGLLVLNNDRSYLSLEHMEAALRTWVHRASGGSVPSRHAHTHAHAYPSIIHPMVT